MRRALRCGLLLAAFALSGPAVAQSVGFEVAQAGVALDQRSGQSVVQVRLTPEAAKLFAEFTTQNVGKQVEIRVNQKVIHAVVIREPITGGRLQLAPDTEQSAKELAAQLAPGAKIEFGPAGN